MGRLRRRLAGLKSAETPQEEGSDERLLFWSLWNPDCPQAVGQMKGLSTSAMHDFQVVAPRIPNKKKKRLRVPTRLLNCSTGNGLPGDSSFKIVKTEFGGSLQPK